MIYDELELKIKQVSADLQILEENMRNNNPVYQRLMGQYDVLIQLQKEKEKDEKVKEGDDPSGYTSSLTPIPEKEVTDE